MRRESSTQVVYLQQMPNGNPIRVLATVTTSATTRNGDRVVANKKEKYLVIKTSLLKPFKMGTNIAMWIGTTRYRILLDKTLADSNLHGDETILRFREDNVPD